jgi:hypothetical protein
MIPDKSAGSSICSCRCAIINPMLAGKYRRPLRSQRTAPNGWPAALSASQFPLSCRLAVLMTIGLTASAVALTGCSAEPAATSQATKSTASPAPPAPDRVSGPVRECSLFGINDDTEVELSGPSAPTACREAAAGHWPSYLTKYGAWQESAGPADDPLSSEICTASTPGSIWTFYNASPASSDTQAECQALQQEGWQVTQGQG